MPLEQLLCTVRKHHGHVGGSYSQKLEAEECPE